MAQKLPWEPGPGADEARVQLFYPHLGGHRGHRETHPPCSQVQPSLHSKARPPVHMAPETLGGPHPC